MKAAAENSPSALSPPGPVWESAGPGPARRQRNARGQGARLTEEIVTAALALIERDGSAEAVTLRAVAREVGIAAPSIYPHFADRTAIIRAVAQRLFDELSDAIEQGSASAGPDPGSRLIGGCDGYVAYGLAHPARYGVLFSRERTADGDYCAPVPLDPAGRPVLELGGEAFGLLVQGLADCVTAGSSASCDVLADAIAVWVAMHGTVGLRTSRPGFPWPDPGPFVASLVRSLARLQP